MSVVSFPEGVSKDGDKKSEKKEEEKDGNKDGKSKKGDQTTKDKEDKRSDRPAGKDDKGWWVGWLLVYVSHALRACPSATTGVMLPAPLLLYH